ncbi:MAG TPA: chromosomal replication initiator protein DnaA [Gammaproteobacteria bacterium]|nr:chromosomal replication initiator protein DnaA [Gammaproteobacteria bacterium]
MDLWEECLSHFKRTVDDQPFNTWILPIQAIQQGQTLFLYFHNQIVLDRFQAEYIASLENLLLQLNRPSMNISLKMGIKKTFSSTPSVSQKVIVNKPTRNPNLNKTFVIDSFVEGPSNAIAKAAAIRVAETPGSSYNPFVIYGPVGLGKTHLMQSVGHSHLAINPDAKVEYLHSEGFVSRMVSSLQRGEMEAFKKHFRSLKILMIDDIQFLTQKERSQEELFHTINHLLERGSQVILTTDCYPKELTGIEERLKSRFTWGLTVGIDPPELETRVAILIRKAELSGVALPEEVAFFMAALIKSNVRELEGSLKRVIANAHFTGQSITLDFVKEALKDIVSLQAKSVNLDSIQKTVARYYKLRMQDLLSKRRNRSIARPRQVAMYLAKENTTKSLPEIGEAFGGRDHTTVLHAVKTVKRLINELPEMAEDVEILSRQIS